MSTNNYYKKLFNIECLNIEKIVFDKMELLAEWEKNRKNDIFHAVGLINDIIYCLYYDETKGFLIIPAEAIINNDFENVIRYNKSSNNIDYTIYKRKNNMLYETKYNFVLLDDSILLNHYTKKYNMNYIGNIYDIYKFYDNNFLDDKLYDVCSSVIVNRHLDKISYIKHNSNDIKDSYKEINDYGLYLYDVANYAMKEEKDLVL